MSPTLREIQREYLQKAWSRPLRDLEASLPGRWEGGALRFRAFGGACELRPEEVLLDGEPLDGPEGVLIALYASQADEEPVRLQPLKAFRQFRGGMNYQAAFSQNAERILLPYVPSIQKAKEALIARFDGNLNLDVKRYHFSFTLYPLPKVPLYYLFNLEDEEFPATVTCLFSSNADRFLPVEGLADTAEYTAKRIIALLAQGSHEPQIRMRS
ncbi:MAG: DUF3786 domain-containing protein [Desulfobacterota bacterium]|nr:DUF3786 domain-containing protein [Thermodesulfobacteriota bacterium]